MRGRRALIVGATGLVGSHCLDRLLAEDIFTQVVVLTRRPLGREHAKLFEQEIDFDKLVNYGGLMEVDDVFCCLGTTLKAAGSQEAFEQVDYWYVKHLAELAAQAGVTQFLLVSAVGADPKSLFFYNRIKGQAEAVVRAQSFRTVHILRPSLLLGARRERRPGEDFAKPIAKMLSPFLFGPLKRYRPVRAEHVAEFMVHLAKQDGPGVHVHFPSSISQEVLA